MFINKYIVEKKDNNGNHFKLYFNNKNSAYSLSEKSLSQHIFHKLNEGQDFFLLYESHNAKEPLAISFNGEYFEPITKEMTEKQKQFINITNNEYKLDMFSFIHLSTIYSGDPKSYFIFSSGWLISFFSTSFILSKYDFSNLSTLLTSMILFLTILISISKIRLKYNSLYVKHNKIKYKKRKILSIIPLVYEEDNNDISLDSIKFNRKKPTDEERIIIDNYVSKTLKDKPTNLIVLQNLIYSKDITKKQINNEINKVLAKSL